MQIIKDRTWKNYRRASLRPHIHHHHHQLSHVTLNYAVPLAVCILMLPMLVVAIEHMQLTATYRMNPLDRCNHVTFIRTPLVLPSLNNVLPAMVLQNRVVRLNIGYTSCFSSHSSVQHVFRSLGVRVYSSLGRRVVEVVVVLLLLLCGDIEMNPGPLGQEDLSVLHRELHQVSHKWYSLGAQLQIPIGTLQCIEMENRQMTNCLLEMLSTWLQCTSPPPTWSVLTEALESPLMEERLLAQQLRDKYCPRSEGWVTPSYPTQGPSPPSAPSTLQGVILSTTKRSRDSGEEQSTPGVKRRRVHEENSMLFLSGLKSESVHGESVTPTRGISYQHQHDDSTSQPSSQLHLPLPQVGHHPIHHHQPPVQPHTYHSLVHAPLGKPVQKSKFIQPLSYQASHQPPSPPPLQHTTSKTSRERPRPAHMYQPPYQHPSPHLSPPFQIHSPPHPGKYAIFFREYYTRHHAPCTKWPHLDAGKYVNLALINNVYANREDLVQFREQTILGCIDDILEWKAPIRMEDILKPNCVYNSHKQRQEYPVTQLLIEGAPGIGKSTFAWEVCQKWGQHQLFNEYYLVVLLKFRDKRVQEAKSVSDLFYHPLPELQSEIVDYITSTDGHGLLLILDGFDEVPASKRTTDSIFIRLFRGQELSKATVILTTRPSASAELRKFCTSVNSRRIEIVGFGKKEIDEYIQCAFSDEQLRSDFKEYLFLYPYIHSMMYIPLNSAIVTHVYESCKSSGTVVPKTMTQLYSSLIRTLLLRYLKDKEYKDTCTNINSFKDLPQPVNDQFCEICKIAYTRIMSAKTKLIFQDLPSDFDTLGLMQTCPELYVDRGASVSYNFLHLTLQEYLAAYHLSQQSRDEQVAFMRKHIESKKLEVVVRFLAGLSELGKDLWDIVRGFASMGRPNHSSLEEETNFIKLKILHCLFESQDSLAITSVLGSDYVCFSYDSPLPFDLYVLGYCITHSGCDWKLELEDCTLISVKAFLRVLNLQQDQYQLSSTGQIKGVWLRSSDAAAVHSFVDYMSQLLVFHNLTHLGLSLCSLTSETCNLLSKQTDLQHHLEYLRICGGDIGNGGAVNLIASLTKFSTIRELHLFSTDIGSEDCKALSELLASSNYIEVLSIGHNDLSPDSIQLIVDGLTHNTSLEVLEMSASNFSSENVLHLATVLRVNTRLKELDMQLCNIPSSDFVHLAKALEYAQLQALRLNGNPIGSEGAVAFASMLKKNQCLKTLNLYDDSVGVEGALELIESLKHNTTLEELELSDKYKPLFSTLDKTRLDHLAFYQILQDDVAISDVHGEEFDDDHYLSIVKQVMEEHGTIDQTIMHCIFVGPAGVGKSSLLKRLLHQKLNPNQCSTQLSEKSVQVKIIRDVSKFAAQVTDFEWKIMEDPITQASELIGQLPAKQKMVFDDPNQQVSEHLDEQATQASEVREQSSLKEKAFQQNQSTVDSSNEKTSEQIGKISQPDPLSIFKHTTSRSPDPQHSQYNKSMEFLLHVLREKGISGVRQRVDNPQTLYLTDSGGQPEFQELLPALIVGPCVFFVVFPLHKDLTRKHKVQYMRPNEHKSTQEYISSLTIQGDILRSLASIASTKYLDIDGNEVQPKVMLIATFKDKVPLEEDRQRKLEALEALVKETDAYHQKMILNASATQITFTINNLSDKESEEDAKKIRRVIENVADEFKIHTPFPWLIFNILVQHVYAKDSVISKEECFKLAQECEIHNETDFNAALQFLHKQTGVLHYYMNPPELSQIVVRDPQHLFSRVTELVEKTFVHKNTPYGCCIENFEKGIFTKGDYMKLTKRSNSSKLTPTMLLKLLEHFNVVVPLGDSQKYFMPCAITHISEETDTGCTRSATVPPMLITFKSGYCPKGLFGGLVACIANKQVASCTLNLDVSKIHRDQIRFTMDQHYLLLRVNPTCIYIEIIPNDPDASLSTFCTPCNGVRELILAKIKTACEKLHYSDNIDCRISFECPCNQPENFHPAALRADIKDCFMCIQSKKVVDIRKECYVWLPQPTIIQNPESRSVAPGTEAVFKVKATGDVLQFQWRKNGSNIHDQDSRYCGTDRDCLHVFMVEKGDEGRYSCCVKNYKGEEFSKNAVLTVKTLVDVPRQSSPCSPSEDITARKSLDTKPRMAQLMKLKNAKGEKVEIIKTVEPGWKDVGFLMDLDPNGATVASIEAEHAHKRKGPATCCQEIFRHWLDKPDATWGNLIELLTDLEHKQLATQVKDALDL